MDGARRTQRHEAVPATRCDGQHDGCDDQRSVDPARVRRLGARPLLRAAPGPEAPADHRAEPAHDSHALSRMLTLVKLLQSLVKALHSEGTPGQLAAGIALGSI